MVKEEQQLSNETNSEFRELSEEELKIILENHMKWLESNGKQGKRADLHLTNLRDANLKKANLFRANLKKAELIGSILQKADLREANLQYADLGVLIFNGQSLREPIYKKPIFG